MTLSDRIQRLIGRQSKIVLVRRRPEILLSGNVPQPMHGLAPRVVLGVKWWNETRRAAYRSTLYHCAACGVWKGDAQFRQWLEGHELYEIDYPRGRMTYLETIPLCHCCHNYVHSGRLQALLDRGEITHAKYAAIVQHGDRVLADAGLKRLEPYAGPFAAWEKWRLIVDGREYKPVYKNLRAWEKEFGRCPRLSRKSRRSSRPTR